MNSITTFFIYVLVERATFIYYFKIIYIAMRERFSEQVPLDTCCLGTWETFSRATESASFLSQH